jgi:hypothetical protein
MTRTGLTTAIAALVLCAGAATASAQSSGSGRGLEVGVGALWNGRTPLASGNGTETTSTGGAFNLFTTSTTLGAVTAGEVLVGWHLSHQFQVFVDGSYGRRQLRIEAANDAESAQPLTATEQLEQFTITGGAMWRFARSGWSPFVRGEGGTLRQRHEDKTLVESGRVFMVGAGVDVPLASRGGGKAIGLRIDARAVARSKNFALNPTKEIAPAAGVALFIQF